jgi:hypothetical protein
MRKVFLDIDSLRIFIGSNLTNYLKKIDNKFSLKNYTNYDTKFYNIFKYKNKRYLLVLYNVLPFNTSGWDLEKNGCWFVNPENSIVTVEIYQIKQTKLKLIGIIHKTNINKVNFCDKRYELLKYVVDQYTRYCKNNDDIIIIDKYKFSRPDYLKDVTYVNTSYIHNWFTDEKYIVHQKAFSTLSYRNKYCNTKKEANFWYSPFYFETDDIMARTEIFKLQENKQKHITTLYTKGSMVFYFVVRHEYNDSPENKPKFINLPVLDYIVCLPFNDCYNYVDNEDYRLAIWNDELTIIYTSETFMLVKTDKFIALTSLLDKYTNYLQYYKKLDKVLYKIRI